MRLFSASEAQGNDSRSNKFDPGLTKQLKKQHKKMTTYLVMAQAAVASEELSEICKYLGGLHEMLLKHIFLEKVYVYEYLGEQPRTEGAAVARGFSDELVALREPVFDFINTYSKSLVGIDDLDDFGERLRVVANTLTARFERAEAELYPLYV